MVLGLSSDKVPARVQPFFGYRNERMLVVSGRALRRREPVFDKRGFWRSLSTMIGQYASREIAGMAVEFEFETGTGEVIRETATTNSEGFVQFEIPFAQSYPLPAKTDWERAIIRWQPDPQGPTREKAVFILAPGKEAGLGVISDIDDTILETGITGSLRAIMRNWKRVMAQMPGERVVAPGAPDFYAALSGNDASRGQRDPRQKSPIPQPLPRPIFYVSSSPWNLFSYLVTFKHQRDLPLGPIMLRDWGFNRKTLGSEGHGSHKHIAVKRILEAYPDLKFVLIGDDTQKDLSVFGTVAATQPDRVAAVFIRRISGREFSDNEQTIHVGVEESGVPFWMGDDYSEARAFLSRSGLDFDHQGLE